jgi:hypothetical protein
VPIQFLASLGNSHYQRWPALVIQILLSLNEIRAQCTISKKGKHGGPLLLMKYVHNALSRKKVSTVTRSCNPNSTFFNKIRAQCTISKKKVSMSPWPVAPATQRPRDKDKCALGGRRIHSPTGEGKSSRLWCRGYVASFFFLKRTGKRVTR